MPSSGHFRRRRLRPAPTTDAEASALLDSIAENLLRLSPEGATSLGIDKGERAALRSQLGDRSAAASSALPRRFAPTSPAPMRSTRRRSTIPTRTSVEVVRSAYATALEGFALPYGDVAVGGWRNTPYVVIQNVGAYLDVPRFLDSDHQINERGRRARPIWRACSPIRSSSTASWGAIRGCARQGPGSARLPDRQGAQPARAERRRRPQGRRPGRIDRAPHAREEHPRQLGRARPRDRRAGGRAGARTADRRADAPARAGDEATPGMWARPGGDELLPLGAQGLDHHDHDARRGPPDGPRRAARASGPDGPDPQEPRLHQGLGRRADAGAGQGPALQIRAGRQGPRRDHGLHRGAAADHPRQAAADVQHAGEGQSRGPPLAAGGRARRARALTAAPARSTAPSPASSGSTCGRPTCTPSSTCPTSPTTRRSRATSGRANMPTSCR